MKSPNSSEVDDEYNRTLYVRLPHTIHNMDEIRDLFAGDIQIKLPRQSSRHCHVIFSTVEEKMKNLKEVRKKRINDKRITACPPKAKPEIQKKKIEKKTTMPSPKPEQKITRILYVTNINQKTTANTIKKALGSCKSVTFLDNIGKDVKQAIVRFSDPQRAVEYLKKERPWPVLDGNQLVIKPDTRKQKKKSPGLKMWDGDVEITDGLKLDEINNTKNTKNTKEVAAKKKKMHVQKSPTIKKNKIKKKKSVSLNSTTDEEK
ncbi:hypothetical protein PV327_000751 [Microctonus hyperodae]|uniref:RRM domain-containing protein n=1 Tax=Microctonus hyperodae TaxID=165561 RepID=A0AA39L2P7_MICHY|nr:hypothetical protein PV327_000751 [Microctonus hyperodae]